MANTDKDKEVSAEQEYDKSRQERLLTKEISDELTDKYIPSG